MAQYLIRRLTSGLGVMAALVVLVFLAAYVIGDPVSLQRNPDFFTDEEMEAMAEQLGYRRPLPEQFVDYVQGVATGDFGISVMQSRPANDVVLDRQHHALAAAVRDLGLVFQLTGGDDHRSG